MKKIIKVISYIFLIYCFLSPIMVGLSQYFDFNCSDLNDCLPYDIFLITHIVLASLAYLYVIYYVCSKCLCHDEEPEIKQNDTQIAQVEGDVATNKKYNTRDLIKDIILHNNKKTYIGETSLV